MGVPAATFVVRRVDAALVEPVGLIREPEEVPMAAMMAVVLAAGSRERGVSLERLAEAIKRCRGRMRA